MRFSRRIQLVASLLLAAGVAASAQAEQPTFVYERSIPGYYLASARGIAVDETGAAYVAGSYYSDQVQLDIFVFKVAPDGTVVWTRGIEGESHDYSQDIALAPDGDVWIVGWSDSEDYPITADAMDNTLTGFRDVVLTRLSAADGTILYSTYLGGDYTEHGNGIAFDQQGNIVLVGSTGSTDYPTTDDAWQSGPSAPLYVYTDAFVTRLDPTGRTILYSTYFGGFEDDEAENVRLDAQGNMVFSGRTGADDFPLTNAIQSNPNSIFVSKLSADGGTLMFSTYFGGMDYDRLWDMDLDDAGYVYLAGSTQSVDFPTTPGAFQEDFEGDILGCGDPPFIPLFNCDDGFVAKMATDGGGLVFSTFLGGSGIDELHGIAVDAEGCVHVTGKTSSGDFPGTVEPGLILVSQLDPTGSDLLYTLRRESPYPAYAVATDPATDVYFTGSINLPAEFYVAKLTDGQTSDVSDGASVGATPSLIGGAPNPFSNSTRISYTVPGSRSTAVFLAVYDASGREIRTLVAGDRGPGDHVVVWDGENSRGEAVPSGIYYYVLRGNGQRAVGHAVRIR